MSDSATVLGLEDLGRSVDLFTQAVQRRMIRKAGNAGAEVFRREIRAKAPVREDDYTKGKNQRKPGYLKKHIGRTSKASNDSYKVSVGPMPGAFYAKFIELGTGHQPAKPFIRPAFDSKVHDAETKFTETMKAELAAGLK